jgi:hypothetical protein
MILQDDLDDLDEDDEDEDDFDDEDGDEEEDGDEDEPETWQVARCPYGVEMTQLRLTSVMRRA